MCTFPTSCVLLHPGSTPPILTPSWRTMETRWCLATLTPTIPPDTPGQEMTKQGPEEKRFDGAINSSQLAAVNLDLPTRPLDLPTRSSSRPSWKPWLQIVKASNQGTPRIRPCSLFLQVWSHASISESLLAEQLP